MSDEQKRFKTDAAAYLDLNGHDKQSDPPTVEVAGAGRWVARRAYKLGWTQKIFQREIHGYYDYSRDRVERIGKKYQWIALNELLCQLADNFWMGGGMSDGTRRYESPLDIGYFRDVDPTVLESPHKTTVNQVANDWIHGPAIHLPETDEATLGKWPFLKDPAKFLAQLIYRTDGNRRLWLTLYDHYNATDHYDQGRRGMEHGIRQKEFRFVLSAIVRKSDVARFVDYFAGRKSVDVMHWDATEFTDGPFLHESPWRTLWEAPKWRDDSWNAPKGLSVAVPLYEYHWESHLDASLPNGATALMPSTWLIRELKLHRERNNAECLLSDEGTVRFTLSRVPGDRTAALIDSDYFLNYLNANGLACVWLFVAERAVWPGGNNLRAGWRRSEGCCWFHSDRKLRTKTWYRDQINKPKS